jgi:hypothetical protein
MYARELAQYRIDDLHREAERGRRALAAGGRGSGEAARPRRRARGFLAAVATVVPSALRR